MGKCNKKTTHPWTWLLNLENSDRPHSSYLLFLQLYIAMIVASNRRSNSFFSSSTSTMGRGRWKTCSGNLRPLDSTNMTCQDVLGDSFCSKHDTFSIIFPYPTARDSLHSSPWAPCQLDPFLPTLAKQKPSPDDSCWKSSTLRYSSRTGNAKNHTFSKSR